MMTAERYAANETGEAEEEPDDIMGKIWWNFKQWHFKYIHGVSKALFSQQVQGNTPLLKVMEKLHVTEKEATQFLKMFEKIDTDHSGSISLYEFFDYFRLDENEFIERAFNVMDFDKEGTHGGSGVGEMNYTEFFVSLFNFCTLTRPTLEKFTFAVIDKDNSGVIDREEMHDMIEMLHSNRRDPQGDNAEAKKIMNLLDENHDGAVTLDEFQRCSRRVASMMFPAFTLQKKMRARTMNRRFWAKATAKRMDLDKEGHNDLVELYHEVLAEIEAQKELEELLRKQREAEEEELKKLQQKVLTEDELSQIENDANDMIEQLDSSFKVEKDARNDVEEDNMDNEPTYEYHSGSWWAEDGHTEAKIYEEEDIVVPDRPITASINIDRAQNKLKVTRQTAMALMREKQGKERAEELQDKADEIEEMKREMWAMIEEAEMVAQEEAEIEARKSFVTKQKVKWKRRCAPCKCCCRLLWYTLFFPISWPMACCKCLYRKCCKSKHPRIEGL